MGKCENNGIQAEKPDEFLQKATTEQRIDTNNNNNNNEKEF